jgi:hypothetical protein
MPLMLPGFHQIGFLVTGFFGLALLHLHQVYLFLIASLI